MKVSDLKEMLSGVPDDMDVLISVTGEFDGAFCAPCMEESGPAGLGIYYDEEDQKEAELLGKPTEEKSFILVRCGFFKEHDIKPDLN